MRDIQFYLDTARLRHRLTSDRQLSTAIRAGSQGAFFWRSGRSYPSDEAMIRLAVLAGIDPAEALLDLNRWRSDGQAKAIYTDLARRLTQSAAAILVAAIIVAGGPVVAETSREPLKVDSAVQCIL